VNRAFVATGRVERRAQVPAPRAFPDLTVRSSMARAPSGGGSAVAVSRLRPGSRASVAQAAGAA